MKPERSDVDLIRTIALWMELTDQGGSPAFPYEYKANIDIDSIDADSPAKGSIMFPIGMLSLIAGFIMLFFNWRLGIAAIFFGPAILFIGYKLQGGAANPDILKENSSLFRKEGQRVFDWMERG